MHTLQTKRKIYLQLEAETPPAPFHFLMALGFSPGKKPHFGGSGKTMKVLRDGPTIPQKCLTVFVLCRLCIISLN